LDDAPKRGVARCFSSIVIDLEENTMVRRCRVLAVSSPGRLKVQIDRSISPPSATKSGALESEKSGLRLVKAGREETTSMAEPNTTAEEQAQPNPNEKLVKVFDSEQESEALVVKGLLESAGIDSDLASASLLQDAFPGMGGMIITVREEDAGRAQQLIAESRQAVRASSDEPDDDETKG
jgi:hypothetical protein